MNDKLTERIRRILSDWKKFDEKRIIQISSGLNGGVEKTEDLRNEKTSHCWKSNLKDLLKNIL